MSADGSLATSVSDLNAHLALEQVKTAIGRGDDPMAILSQCREGLDEIGKKYESGEYFIADLVFAASIFKDVMNVLGPELRKSDSGTRKLGKVAIATVKDDIHDIGKNLVASMLDAAGFEVFDLGVDVPVDKICKCIADQQPDIVALSCLLTSTVDSMERTIAEISRLGARSKVKILVGGVPLTPDVAVAIGSDAYGDSATEAVIKCRELMGESGK